MFIKGDSLDKSGLRNILLIQLGDIGDVVYSLPCARALKENFPQARVVVAVHNKARGLVVGCPWIDDVITVDKTKRTGWAAITYQIKFWQQVRDFHFDLAIDLRTGSRGAIMAFLSGASQRVGRYHSVGRWWRSWLFSHLVLPKGRMNQYIAEYYLDTISSYGFTTSEINPVIYPLKDQVKEAERILLREHVPCEHPILAIQPFSLWTYKEWAIEKYVRLIHGLQTEFALCIILTGSPEEKERVQSIVQGCGGKGIFNLAGKTSLDLLPALLKRAALFVGVDSAGLHIAAAVGTPTVSLYGPSAADIWAPKGNEHLVIAKKLPCVPCKETGCQGKMKSLCLDTLTVEEVLPVVKKKLRLACRQLDEIDND